MMDFFYVILHGFSFLNFYCLTSANMFEQISKFDLIIQILFRRTLRYIKYFPKKLKRTCKDKISTLYYYRPHPKDDGRLYFHFVCQSTPRRGGGSQVQDQVGGGTRSSHGWGGFPVFRILVGFQVSDFRGGSQVSDFPGGGTCSRSQ